LFSIYILVIVKLYVFQTVANLFPLVLKASLLRKEKHSEYVALFNFPYDHIELVNGKCVTSENENMAFFIYFCGGVYKNPQIVVSVLFKA